VPENLARGLGNLPGKFAWQFVDDEWVILGQKAPHAQGRRALRPSIGAADQDAVGHERVDQRAIGVDGAFGMRECALDIDRDRGGQPHRVASPGDGDEPHSACALLELIPGNSACPPIDRLAETLRSRPGSARLHLMVDIDAAGPTPHNAVDDDRCMNIERAVRREQELGHVDHMGRRMGNCEPTNGRCGPGTSCKRLVQACGSTPSFDQA
jgi:hypothetical protein